MGKGKIIWSLSAKSKLFKILEFYSARNKSKSYSVKLYGRFRTELAILLNQPEIGVKTEIENVRGFIIEHFIFFYEPQGKNIIVHTLWDSRQNPTDLKIKDNDI
jgi:plasmid stabilization system protein ParE